MAAQTHDHRDHRGPLFLIASAVVFAAIGVAVLEADSSLAVVGWIALAASLGDLLYAIAVAVRPDVH